MLLLIWAMLLFSGRDSSADTGASVEGRKLCQNRSCDTRNEGKAEARLCANVSVEDLIQKPRVVVPPLTEGQQATLTCTVSVLCSGSDPKITWTWGGTGDNASHITGNITASKTENLTAVTRRHSSTLTFNSSVEHCGTNVTCKVSFTNNMTAEETVTLNVTLFPKILKSSACEVHSEVLRCVCISQGLPLPTVKMPLLETHTEYSIITTASNHMVNISVSVPVKDLNYTTVGCISSSVVGEAKENLMIRINELKPEDLFEKLFIIVKQPQVIIAFFTGIFLSATICCFGRKCHRKRSNSSGNMVETLEMVTAQVVPLMDASKSVGNDKTHDQEAAEGGAEAAGQSVPDVEPREVEYSNIDFSRWNRKSPTGAEDAQETTETEYAELKKEEAGARQDNGGENGDILEGNKEEVAMIGQDEETKQCTSVQEEELEEVAVYSNVKEIMTDI